MFYLNGGYASEAQSNVTSEQRLGLYTVKLS